MAVRLFSGVRLCWGVALLVGVFLFAMAVTQSRGVQRPQLIPEIQVALPLFVQVGMAAGDRYLAANGASVRALVTSTLRMGPDEYALLAKLQNDVSWLNPAHEDNYYTAAAILPWNGQLEAAQNILRRATQARPHDYQPAFFYAFHLLYFDQDPVAAGGWLRRAAERLPDGDEKLAMQNYAARWIEKDKDLDNAIAVVTAMARQARRDDFRHYLELRVSRMQNLKLLREKAAVLAERKGQPLHSLDELVEARLLREIPPDPFGFGYDLSVDGKITLRSSPRQ